MMTAALPIVLVVLTGAIAAAAWRIGREVSGLTSRVRDLHEEVMRLRRGTTDAAVTALAAVAPAPVAPTYEFAAL